MVKPGRTALILLAAALAAGPLAADWLVLTDGTRLETRGAWEERGRLVVFTATDGTLASLRLEGVDLEASRRATAEAAQPAAPAPAAPAAEPRQATFVLTDDDVAHNLTTGSAEDAGEVAPTAAPQGQRLVVTDWQEAPLADESGTLVTGTLRNVSSDATTRIQLTVLAYDASGDLLATNNAMLSSQALMPNQQARFQVEFNGIYTIAAVTFRPSTLPLGAGAPAGEAEPSGAATEEETPAGAATEEETSG
jgi:hypothetical protein